MEELKEDYSGLSRNEALELAKGWIEESYVLSEEKYLYKEAAILLQKALPIFKKFEDWSSYIQGRSMMIFVYHMTRNNDFITNPELYIEETLQLCRELLPRIHEMVIHLLNNLGTYYEEIGDSQKVLEYSLECLFVAQQLYESIDELVVKAYKGVAMAYQFLGDYPKSIEFGLKALHLAQQNGSKLLIVNVSFNLSNVYRLYEDIESSFRIINNALQIALQVQKTKKIPDAYFFLIYANIGTCYSYLKDYGQQILYLQKALTIITADLGEKHFRTASLQRSLGVAFLRNQQFEKSLYYLELVLKNLQETFTSDNPTIAGAHSWLSRYYIKTGNYSKALFHVQKTLDIRLEVFGKNHPDTIKAFRILVAVFSEFGKYNEALKVIEENIEQAIQFWGRSHLTIANYYNEIADVHLKADNTKEAVLAIFQAEKILLDKKTEAFSTFRFPHYQTYPIIHSKAKSLFQHYLQKTQGLDDLKKALQAFEQSLEILDKMRQGYHNESSKLLWGATESKLYEEGIEAALEMNVFGVDAQTTAFLFSEKAKASLLLTSLQTELAKTTAQISTELQEEEKQMKLKLTYLDKYIQKLQSKKEKEELNEYETLSLKDCQDKFFHLHQNYTAFLQQLETNYPEYYQLKYDIKTVSPTELQSILQENQIVISYFVGEEKLYIFVVTPDEFEVIYLQKTTNFETLIEDFMEALTQHQFAAFTQKAHQLHQLLIAPIRDFIVDDFAFDKEELKQVFVIPHGVLSYLPFEVLVEQPLSRFSTIDKVKETLSTAESLDNNSPFEGGQGDVWNRLNYLIHHCEISYHYSATLLHRHLLKKQTQEEFPNSFAGFAPIYDENTPRSSKSTTSIPLQSEALQQSAKSMQSWATRSDAIRSDGTWVSLPHSEMEAKNIAKLFEEHGLEAETFLREKASKEGFTEAAKQFKFLLVAAHGLVNDEKTALSGLVFYPSDGSEKREVRSETIEDINESAFPTSHFSHPTSQIDSVLSMEETHHLDLQADLVVLSSCESGIGTLHKGEGMMAVNRGFLAAGANNVVSTLFKVYDKPSSLLTQYLFEAILEGKTYSAALRVAKLKLMKQANIDPKSWSGFVLIGG